MLTVFNTLSRQKEPFHPIKQGRVNMYVCGMTTYDYCHIGHARMLVAFDLIYRWLMASGYKINYVRNITDIDDKIIKRAAEYNETIQSLTSRFIHAMHEDIYALNVLAPSKEPRATDHITDMINMINTLIYKGKAYPAENGDVYYAVRMFPDYGKLSGKTLDSLRAGERVEIDHMKRTPFDFVLWKAAKPGEPYWNSPWGKGRPGWHIECSAMSCDYLGEHFDIHGGGADLQFPHHENEIAQSEGANGHKYVNYWLHNGFITVDGIKMSKSLGNFFTIRDVLTQYDGEVIRFFIARSHYRSAVNYTTNAMDEADQTLEKLYRTLRPFDAVLPAQIKVNWETHYAKKFKTAMDDDFNSPLAISVLQEMANEINKTQNNELAAQLKALANVQGLLTQEPTIFLQQRKKPTITRHHEASTLNSNQNSIINPDKSNYLTPDISAIEDRIAKRDAARAAKNWAESDRIRNELAESGIILEDGAQGTTWRQA